MLLNIAYVIVGFVGLFVGGDWLVRGAARLASSFGVPPIVVGLTVVAFGTSAPELVVCLDAALRDVPDIALGNVVGSNIANIGLILGITALVAPFAAQWTLIRREIPIMIGALAGAALLALDGEVSRADGLALVAGLCVFIVLSVMWALRDRQQIAPEVEYFDQTGGYTDWRPIHRLRELAFLVVGLVVLIVSAQLLVDGAVYVALALGVSEFIIGITLVAVGTSIPELATCLIAALRHQNDIAVGNIVGSNIMNTFAILGITAAVRPIPVDVAAAQLQLLVMVIFSGSLIFMLNDLVLDRRDGVLLLSGYLVFTIVSFLG